MIKVIKRNGTEVEFDKSKIVNAIRKAWIQVYNDTAREEPEYFNMIADSIERVANQTFADSGKYLTVENIQELVTAMLDLLQDGESTYNRENISSYAKEKFTVNEMIDAYLEVYCKACRI